MLRGDSSYIVDTRGETRRNIKTKNHKKEVFFFLRWPHIWRVCIGWGGGGGGEEFLCCHPVHAKGGEGGFGTCCCYTAPARGTVFIYPLSCVSAAERGELGGWMLGAVF
jgi:hypothetical protein